LAVEPPSGTDCCSRRVPSFFRCIFQEGGQVFAHRVGQANFDIDSDKIDRRQLVFFEECEILTKLLSFERDLCEKVKNGELLDNHSVYLYSLEYGMLPSHARSILKKMVELGQLPKQTFTVSKGAMGKPAFPIMREQ
jgi:hypothetical protein